MFFYPPLLLWWGMLFFIGLSFLPVTHKLFSSFIDGGYAFSKIIGVLVVSYTIYVLGTLHIAPFTFPITLLILAAFTLCNWVPMYLRYKKGEKNIRTTLSLPTLIPLLRTVIFEEVLFFCILAVYSYIRAQEPSIHGLEKFMDFGFINSILRALSFPALDMWYGPDQLAPHGYAINYYYFGHLYAAVLVRLSRVAPDVGYNLILGTILALGFTQSFSFIASIANIYKKASAYVLYVIGIIGAFLVNLSGNFHTVYLFTTGYPNDKPIPFWQIISAFHPEKYWYPNATRFIPYTIHEFPSYSYVVADLHGHVFDIPIVLLTIAILFVFYILNQTKKNTSDHHRARFTISIPPTLRLLNRNTVSVVPNDLYATLFGAMIAIHYMTNAFDGPIYLLLILITAFILFKVTQRFVRFGGIVLASFILFSLPFTFFFKPFASGIGVNCAPLFLTNLHKIGPFLFEANNCQISPLWMLFVLWGFFFINFVLLLISRKLTRSPYSDRVFHQAKHLHASQEAKQQGRIQIQKHIEQFFIIFFCFGLFLIVVPEFFYVKDIYPQHFRANTMFKLGYQAFILMSLSSTMVIYILRNRVGNKAVPLKMIFVGGFVLVSLYPFQAFPGYYGQLNKQVNNLNGLEWLKNEKPEDFELVTYINAHISGQPTILEAQGDSYTDYNHTSAFTGLPTVAGWYVHEWLWRGKPEYIGDRAPDVAAIYESDDPELTKTLIQKYHISYVIVSSLERQKYPKLNEEKFEKIGEKIFESNNKVGALYRLK